MGRILHSLLGWSPTSAYRESGFVARPLPEMAKHLIGLGRMTAFGPTLPSSIALELVRNRNPKAAIGGSTNFGVLFVSDGSIADLGLILGHSCSTLYSRLSRTNLLEC
ncbi:MAG: hypothetical protein WBX25_37735 [Rhodomicrobium sp.]